jgi:hypothetical protein
MSVDQKKFLQAMLLQAVDYVMQEGIPPSQLFREVRSSPILICVSRRRSAASCRAARRFRRQPRRARGTVGAASEPWPLAEAGGGGGEGKMALILSAPGKPGSKGKEDMAYSEKFDGETQRVKVPSNQCLASKLEASLAQRWGDPRCET